MRACILVVVAMGVVASAQQPARVPVFVTTAPTQDGSFAPRIGDSLSDLRSEVNNRKRLRLVTREADAHIVLRLTDRQTHAGPPGAIGIPVGAIVVAAPYATNQRVLTVQMEAATIRRTIVGAAELWRAAAKAVSIDVDGWVASNGALAKSRTVPTETPER